MNPISIACLAVSSGCGAGLVVLLRGLSTARDAGREDVDELSEWLKELPEVRSEDVFLAPAAEEPVKVSAR